MDSLPQPSPRLLQASPLLLFSWQELPGRPLLGGLAELQAALDGAAPDSSAPSQHLNELLSAAGRQHLDELLAKTGEQGEGVLRAERVPFLACRGTCDGEGAPQLAWLDLTIEWTQGASEGLTCVAIGMDITDLVAEEREAEIQRERYDLAVEGTRLGTWDWDPSTGNLIINRHWMGMLGEELETHQITAADWEARVHPDDVAGAYSDLAEHIEGRAEIYENTHRMRHRDGH